MTKRTDRAQSIANDLRQSAVANDWPEADAAATVIEASLEHGGGLTTALEAAWDIVEPENPEFAARIRDVIDMSEYA